MRSSLPRASVVQLGFLLLCAVSACATSEPASSSSSQAIESCDSNCDCPFGEYCANRVCQPDFGPFPQCYCTSRDCAAGQVCNLAGTTGGGFCQSTCDDDCDCEHGYVCTGGQCNVDFGPQPTCYCADRDCSVAGQTCVAGACGG